MTRTPKNTIRSPSSAMPAFAGALVACAYLVGGVVFSAVSQGSSEEAREARPVAQVMALFDQAVARVTADTAAHADETGPALTISRNPSADMPRALSSRPDPVIAPSADRASPAPRTGPMIAIVIDDVGMDVAAAQRAVALDAGITLAILPYADAASRIAVDARAAGHDVLLHMPMEPVGLADPGPNSLRVGLSDADIAARTRWAMAQVPGAVGLNNHMGSRFTTDPRAMRVALASVSGQGPLFLDSLTTAHSRGRAVAAGLGLRTLERDIFLDHEIDAEAIADRLAEAEDLANRRGWAVVIGHPHAQTLDALDAWIEGARTRGMDLVTVTALSDALDTAVVPTADASAVQ